jgi:DNA-binding NarL/FixJ family response regulator
VTVRIVLVDDHPMVRDGLTALFDTIDDCDVVGVAADGAEALRVIRELRPDVALMDLAMPVMGGVEATRRLRAEDPDVRVVVLTMSDDDASVRAALRAGARGYLLKDAGQHEVLAAVRAAAHGQLVFGATVVPAVVGLFDPAPAAVPFPDLSQRERQVLDLLAAGLGNQGIARRLGVSDKTVANTVSLVLPKIGAADRAAAIALARAHGLGDLD